MEEQLIRKVVWTFHKKYPEIGYEELFAEARMYYLVTETEFKQRGATMSTLAWLCLHNHLITFCNKYRRIEVAPCGDQQWAWNLPSHFVAADIIILFRESLLSNLSQQALEVCKLIFNSPVEFFPIPNIVDHLKEAGWGIEEIKSAFREIKKFLKNSPQKV